MCHSFYPHLCLLLIIGKQPCEAGCNGCYPVCLPFVYMCNMFTHTRADTHTGSKYRCRALELCCCSLNTICSVNNLLLAQGGHCSVHHRHRKEVVVVVKAIFNFGTFIRQPCAQPGKCVHHQGSGFSFTFPNQ